MPKPVLDVPVRAPVKAPPRSPFHTPGTDSPFHTGTGSPFRTGSPFHSASPFRAAAGAGGAPPRRPFRSPFRSPFDDPRSGGRKASRTTYRRSLILPNLGQRVMPWNWSDWLWLPLDEITEMDGCGCGGHAHIYLPGMGEDFDEWAAEVAARDGCDGDNPLECDDEHSLDLSNGTHLHPLCAVGWEDDQPPIRMSSTYCMLLDWNHAYVPEWLGLLDQAEVIRAELLAKPGVLLESHVGSDLAYDVLTLAGTDIPPGSGPRGLASGAERIQMVYDHLDDDEAVRTAFGDHAVFAYAHHADGDLTADTVGFANAVDTVTDDGVTLASPGMLTMMYFDPLDFAMSETIRVDDLVQLRGAWTAFDAGYHSLIRDPALAARFPWMVGWRSVLMKRDGEIPDDEQERAVEDYNIPLPMFDPNDPA